MRKTIPLEGAGRRRVGNLDHFVRNVIVTKPARDFIAPPKRVVRSQPSKNGRAAGHIGGLADLA
jgi:hypothetical protein